MGGQMMGGMQPPQQKPEQMQEGYRAQRVQGVFGDPVIAALMQQLQGLLGGGNVQLQGMEGGFRPAAGGPATPGFAADPAAAMLMQLFGQGAPGPQAPPGAGVDPAQPVPGTATVPDGLLPQLPQGAPPFTGTVPPPLMADTGRMPPVGAPAMNPFQAIIEAIQAGMGGSMGTQGPQMSLETQAQGPPAGGTPDAPAVMGNLLEV